MGKSRAALGEFVQVWCLDMGMAGKSEISIAQVVSHNDDDVGFIRSGFHHGQKNEGNEKAGHGFRGWFGMKGSLIWSHYEHSKRVVCRIVQ